MLIEVVIQISIISQLILWVGLFRKEDLSGAKNLKLATDVEVSKFVVKFDFESVKDLENFVVSIDSYSLEIKEVLCKTKPKYCDFFIGQPQRIVFFKTNRRNKPPANKLYWFIDKEKFHVIGSSDNPPKKYLL